MAMSRLVHGTPAHNRYRLDFGQFITQICKIDLMVTMDHGAKNNTL